MLTTGGVIWAAISLLGVALIIHYTQWLQINYAYGVPALEIVVLGILVLPMLSVLTTFGAIKVYMDLTD